MQKTLLKLVDYNVWLTKCSENAANLFVTHNGKLNEQEHDCNNKNNGMNCYTKHDRSMKESRKQSGGGIQSNHQKK